MRLLFLQNFARFLLQCGRALSLALCAIGQRLCVAKIAKKQMWIARGTNKSVHILLALFAFLFRGFGNAIAAIATTRRVAAV